MKTKILIVDDEFLERTLIRHGNEWEANGYEIIGEADSGRSALKIIESVQPDIVFTDISMPFMDGLQFTEELKKRYPQIKVAIITGFREFEYARKALKLGVTELILKPVQHEEVLMAADELRSQLKQEKAHHDEMISMRKEIIDHKPIKQELFLRSLITKDIDLNTYDHASAEYDLGF